MIKLCYINYNYGKLSCDWVSVSMPSFKPIQSKCVSGAVCLLSAVWIYFRLLRTACVCRGDITFSILMARIDVKTRRFARKISSVPVHHIFVVHLTPKHPIRLCFKRASLAMLKYYGSIKCTDFLPKSLTSTEIFNIFLKLYLLWTWPFITVHFISCLRGESQQCNRPCFWQNMRETRSCKEKIWILECNKANIDGVQNAIEPILSFEIHCVCNARSESTNSDFMCSRLLSCEYDMISSTKKSRT